MDVGDSFFSDLDLFLPNEHGPECMLPVRHQGNTNSCYAFALVDMLHTKLFFNSPACQLRPDSWKGSEQELLDFVHLAYPPLEPYSITPEGVQNTLEHTIAFIETYGLSLEVNCPFLGYCREFESLSDGRQPHRIRISIQSNSMRLSEVANHQLTDSEINDITGQIIVHPIGMGIISVPSFLAWNSRDIYPGPTQEERDLINQGAVDKKEFKEYGNHMVVFVGCGKDENGKVHFLAKNCWGEDWGHKGFIKLDAKIPPPFYEVVVELTEPPSISWKPFP